MLSSAVTLNYWNSRSCIPPKVPDILWTYIIVVYLREVGLLKFSFRQLLTQNFAPKLMQSFISTNPELWFRLCVNI